MDERAQKDRVRKTYPAAKDVAEKKKNKNGKDRGERGFRFEEERKEEGKE